MRKKLALVFWYLVVLFLLFAPLLLILSVSQAQDAVISAPEDMRHPVTGEEGTWIPRWVERVHVLDAHKLELCLKDVALANQDIFAFEEQTAALEATLADTEHAKDELLVEVYGLERLTTRTDRRLERRLRAVWGLVGASVALAGTTTYLILR